MALVLVLLVPTVARSENSVEVRTYLLSVQRLFEDLEYERALDQINLARRMAREAEDEVTLSLYEGIILCDLSKQEEGRAAFKAALLLRPDAKLPVQVAPKVEQLFESVRQQVKTLPIARSQVGLEKTEAAFQPLPRQQSEAVRSAPALEQAALPDRGLRRHSRVPAIAGGVLVAAGGIAWGVSKGDMNQLRNNDSRLATMEDVQRTVSRGRTWQTVGVSLLSVGAASLAAATGMYVLGAPGKGVSLSVGTNGTSAGIHGRWP
jgi:hypothetical protein